MPHFESGESAGGGTPQTSINEDKSTEKAAENIKDKMFSMKSENVDDGSIVRSIFSGEGINFVADDDGAQKVAMIYPTNQNDIYSLEVQDDKGNVISHIPNLRGVQKTNISTIPGNFLLVVKSQQNNPFTVKIN